MNNSSSQGGPDGTAELTGKVVIITGAGRGIGRAEALACAQAGAKVVVDDLGCAADGSGADASVARETVAEIERAGGMAVSASLDVRDPATPAALVELARTHFGRLDGLLCNAGIQREGSFLHGDPGDLVDTLEVQLLANIRLCRAAAQAMLPQGGGSLVVTTSPSSFFGVRGQTSLGAAGAAVVGFVRAAAIELKRHGIRINALSPMARTRQTEALPMFKNIRASSMTPEQVAPAAVFLLSDRASEVTGEAIGAAGGRIYAYRVRETAGAFLEAEDLTAAAIANIWDQALRG